MSKQTESVRDRRSSIPSLAVSVELARVELRRGYRWLREQDFWLLYGAVAAIAFLFGSWLAFDVARDVGAALAAGEQPTPSLAGIGLTWSVIWLAMVAFLTLDAVGSNGDLDNDGQYLTIRPVADLLGGKLLAAACKFAVYVFVPVIAAYVGLAVGAGTPAPLVGGLVAATVVTVTATAVGYSIGLTLKGIIRRSESLSSLKPILGVGIGVAYVVVMVTGEFVALVDAIEPALLAPPLAWLGDLALFTTPGADVDTIGALVAVAIAIAVVPIGTLSSIRAARFAWSADRNRSGDDESVDITAPDLRVDRLLTYVCRTPESRGIASTTLLRAYRAPLQLIFAAIPLIVAVPMVEAFLATGTLPWYAPWFAVWYGAWAAGATVPLNPLGNHGATLPTLLTAPAHGRQIVHGTVVAASLPVAPLTAGFAVAAGYLADRPVSEIVALVPVSVFTVVAASVLAAGIGSVFPRFEAVDFSGSRQAVPPSKVAYGVFSTGLSATVVAVAAVIDDTALEIVTMVFSTWLPGGSDVTSDAVLTASWIVVALAALSIPLAYRIAVRRLDTYRLD